MAYRTAELKDVAENIQELRFTDMIEVSTWIRDVVANKLGEDGWGEPADWAELLVSWADDYIEHLPEEEKGKGRDR